MAVYGDDGCDLLCLVHWIFFFLWFIMIPFYIVVLAVIRKYRKVEFQSSFFTLFLTVGIVDIAILLISPLVWKLPMGGYITANQLLYDFYMKTPGWAAFLVLVDASLDKTRAFGIMLLCINRYTAITRPTRHDSLWSPTRLKAALGLMFIGGFGMQAPLLLNAAEGAYYFYHRNYYLNGVGNNSLASFDFYGMKPHQVVLYSRYRLFNSFFLWARMILYIFCYSSIIRALISAKRQLQNSRRGVEESNKTELKLAICCLFLVANDTVVFFYDLSIHLYFITGARAFTLALHPSFFFHWLCTQWDFYGWCNPLMLTLTCSNLREKLKGLFGGAENEGESTAKVVTLKKSTKVGEATAGGKKSRMSTGAAAAATANPVEAIPPINI